MAKKRKANPTDLGCPYNRMIECPGPNAEICAKCGWNPLVSEKRAGHWLKEHKGIVFKLYRRSRR